jgi:hypothetical protein
VGIQARPASQIENPAVGFEDGFLKPIHVFFNNGKATAGPIVLLRKVVFQHPLTEFWIVPRNFVAFFPWTRGQFPPAYLFEFHLFYLSENFVVSLSFLR